MWKSKERSAIKMYGKKIKRKETEEKVL